LKTIFFIKIFFHFCFFFNHLIYSSTEIDNDRIAIGYETSGIEYFDNELESLLENIEKISPVEFIKIEKNAKEPSKISSGISKQFLEKLATKNILFYLLFSLSEEKISWQLYNTVTPEFIGGKNYTVNGITVLEEFCLMIAADIWKKLFSKEISPFELTLIYIEQNTVNKTKGNFKIIATNPFSLHKNKTILHEGERPLIDLTVAPSKNGPVILFSQINRDKVSLVKLRYDSNGKKYFDSIVSAHGTATSPCSIEEFLFYILSGTLCVCMYDEETKKFCHKTLDASNGIYGGLAPVIGEKLIAVGAIKKFRGYIFEISKGENKVIFSKQQQFTPQSTIVSSISTHYNIQECIITSEKIDGIFQLVMYDGAEMERKVLTKSKYHKHDPALSPCGGYIAYIAQEENGKRRVETIDIATKSISIISKNGLFRSPSWIHH